MSNIIKNNVTDQNAGDQKLIDGFNKHAATLTSLTIAATTVSNKDIIGQLQSRIATRNAVQPARATWQAAVKAKRDMRTTSDPFVGRVRQLLVLTFADQVDALADFGLTPHAKGVVAPKTMVDAAAKAKATREARHTMGSKQKAAIKGVVDATPSASSAPAAPSPTTPATPVPSAPARS